jgi:hypothetical protein
MRRNSSIWVRRSSGVQESQYAFSSDESNKGETDKAFLSSLREEKSLFFIFQTDDVIFTGFKTIRIILPLDDFNNKELD